MNGLVAVGDDVCVGAGVTVDGGIDVFVEVCVAVGVAVNTGVLTDVATGPSWIGGR